jgi:hypothetical protein
MPSIVVTGAITSKTVCDTAAKLTTQSVANGEAVPCHVNGREQSNMIMVELQGGLGSPDTNSDRLHYEATRV